MKMIEDKISVIKYSELRTSIQTGDIMLFSGSNFVQKTIQRAQWFDDQKYWFLNHAALVLRGDLLNLKDRVYLADATGSSGFSLHQLSKVWKEHGDTYFCKANRMTPEQREQIAADTADKVTSGFSYNLDGAFKAIFGSIAPDCHEYFCSESVWDEYLACGYMIKAMNGAIPTPGQLPVWCNLTLQRILMEE